MINSSALQVPVFPSLTPLAHAGKRVLIGALARWVLFLFGVPRMVDDNKRQHDVKLWLTDREYIDLCKQAEREDRKPGEMGRVVLRRYMYGNIGAAACDCNGANSAEKGIDA